MNEVSELYEESNDLQMDVMPSESHLPHIKDPGYDAYYDENGENHKDDLGYVVAGWGRGLHCSGDCGRWCCKEIPVPGKDSAREDSYDESGEEYGRIQALDLMAVAVGCMVEGPMVGDAARRVRVKPLSRSQSKLMPPRPHDSDALCLSYNFTNDPRHRDDQPWCEVQGEVDQNVFLSYDCGTAKIKYLSPLGEEVKSMSAWETFKDTGDLLQGQMPDITPENHTDKASPTTGPPTVKSSATAIKHITGILPVLLTSFVITVFLG
ncbi:hypothetical protein CapIbe_008538 [Capra ibex]